jgi:hypothetical protein
MRAEIEIYKFAEKWAKKWMRKNKWDEYADEWDTYGMYDINLYVEDNVLSITAYPLVPDTFGALVIATDKMFQVYMCTWHAKSSK